MNELSEVFVQPRDALQHPGVPRVVDEGTHFRPQRILDADLHIIDSGLGVLVELFINSDGVRKRDGRGLLQMGCNVLP